MAPFARVAAALSLLVAGVGATTKVAAGLHEARSKNSLRPYGRHGTHRSDAKRSAQAVTRKVQQDAPKQQPASAAALVDTGVATAASQPYLDAGGDMSESSSMLKGLKKELAEMKQRRVNINSLQQALAADVALLRESAALQRVSSSQEDRAVAAQQVRQSEQIVKDTGAMLRESRMAAMKDAQAVLRDQSALQTALEAVKTEAAEQLQAFQSTSHSGERSQDASAEPSQYPAAPAPPAADNVAVATAAASDDGDDDP